MNTASSKSYMEQLIILLLTHHALASGGMGCQPAGIILFWIWWLFWRHLQMTSCLHEREVVSPLSKCAHLGAQHSGANSSTALGRCGNGRERGGNPDSAPEFSLLICPVTSGELFNTSVPQFPYCEMQWSSSTPPAWHKEKPMLFKLLLTIVLQAT